MLEQILNLTDNVQKSLDRRFKQGNSYTSKKYKIKLNWAYVQAFMMSLDPMSSTEKKEQGKNDQKDEKTTKIKLKIQLKLI